MTEGDELLAFIRRAVADLRVPPHLQEATVEAAARTVIAVLTNPTYLYRLQVVNELLTENQQLRQYIAQQQAFQQRAQAAKPKKQAAKKAVAKNPAVRVKGSTPANRRAFKQGYRGK